MEVCSSGFLARMVPIAEACLYSDGLELTQSERRCLLPCMLTENRGCRAPFIDHLTDADVQDSWNLPSTIRFTALRTRRLNLETVHKNGYEQMQADYHIDSEVAAT
ncbi:hypothetical protein D1007_20186 [Hordeum vulgare]|nr:hypothetical protein D1007_20186 [Hordeum vulgare]